MCNLYSHTRPQQAVRDLAEAMGGDWLDNAGNLPPQPAIFPDTVAPVLRKTKTGHELLRMRWGFPVPEPKPGEKKRKPGYQTNIRQPNWAHWKPWMEPEFRCLVPVTSFCEYQDGSKVPTWFAIDDVRSPYFFASVWMPWNGHRGTKANPSDGDHLLYSFLTTKANAEVAPVHSKAMPVILRTENEWKAWLTGTVAEALQLQKPLPDHTLTVRATGLRQDGAA